MSVAVVFAAGLGASFLAMQMFGEKGTWIAVGLLLCVTIFQDFSYFKTVTPEEVYLEEVNLGFRRGRSEGTHTYSVGNAEYLPVNVDRQALTDAVQAEEGVQLAFIDRRYLTYRLVADNTTDEQRNIKLPVIYYTGYQARDLQSRVKLPTCAGENGCVTVTVPANYQGSFEMKFREPRYWRMAEIVSLIAVAFCILYYRGDLKKLRSMSEKAEI